MSEEAEAEVGGARTTVEEAWATRKAGHLVKKLCDSLGTWQRRYFTLRGPLMLYFVSPAHDDPKGVVLLEGASIQWPTGAAKRHSILDFMQNHGLATPFSFFLHTRGGLKYEFCADTELERMSWVEALVATDVVTPPPTPTPPSSSRESNRTRNSISCSMG